MGARKAGNGHDGLRGSRSAAYGFADCRIVAHNRQRGCRPTVNFDDKAARLGAPAIVSLYDQSARRLSLRCV
jgi:hypothetical protein